MSTYSPGSAPGSPASDYRFTLLSVDLLYEGCDVDSIGPYTFFAAQDLADEAYDRLEPHLTDDEIDGLSANLQALEKWKRSHKAGKVRDDIVRAGRQIVAVNQLLDAAGDFGIAFSRYYALILSEQL